MMMRLVTLALALVLLSACDSRPSDSKPAAPEKSSSPAAATEPAPATQPAVVYTCPMHPEVVSDKPGTCPKCGMDLVLKK